MNRVLACSLPLLFVSLSAAQWAETQKLGNGGESYVSTDGKGHVYATSHLPCKLYVSDDFGKTYKTIHNLPDSFCDVNSTVGPDGKLYVIYIRPGVAGMQVVTSADNGKTIQKAGGLSGPFDREWIVANPVTGEIGFNYSNGYIGGPKSKGIFYASSSDGGKTFKEISRIDREKEGDYPVDPYLTVGTGGRLYAAWAVAASDYNKIDRFMVATSDDGGKSWSNHFEAGKCNAAFGDTQERWMLGSITATGKDSAMVVYQNYLNMNIDGQEINPLLAFYRVTTDGGKTWSAGKPCLSSKEIDQAMRQFLKSRGKAGLTPTYVQSLPWVSGDSKGKIHLAFVDNRAGSKEIGGKNLGMWQVRYSSWSGGSFSESEQVSKAWAAIRPPLDFIGCASDGSNVWVIWTENPNSAGGWEFSGDLYIAKKSIK